MKYTEENLVHSFHPINGVRVTIESNDRENFNKIDNLMVTASQLLEALHEVKKYLDWEFQTKDEIIPDYIVQAYQEIENAIKKATE